jgi:hypothetical protein
MVLASCLPTRDIQNRGRQNADTDYKPIFAAANIAGKKHFCIGQDNAADQGDAVAAAGVSYKNLLRNLGY